MKQNSNTRRCHSVLALRISCLSAMAVSTMLLSADLMATPTGSIGQASIQQVSQIAKITVNGTILEAGTGEPVIGATVIEVGTTTGTTTDIDGHFSINVPVNAELKISYAGFVTQTVKVNGRTNIKISLAEETQVLDEVVVVGYAAQKKVNLTGAVSSVDFDKSKTSRPMTTMAAALSGMAAGLNVMQTGSKPNSEGQNISIRGLGTLNNSGPLILIDGMEADLNQVNPNDVASVSILKDAASCAIYGNRGANGVILITTKKGTDGKINVTYSGKFILNTPQKIIRQVSNYADYMEMINEAYEGNGQVAKFSDATIQEWREASANPNAVDEYGTPNFVTHPNTDWYDTIYKKQWMQEHTVSVTGQDTRTEYAISGTFLHNPGVIVNTGSTNKYYLRANILSHVTKFLGVGIRAWGYHTDQHRDDMDQIWDVQMRKSTPGVYPYFKGYYGGIETTEEDGSTSNILMNISGDHGYYKQDKIYVNPYIELDLPYGFRFTSNFYYDRFNNEHKWQPSEFKQQVSFNRRIYLNYDRTEANMKDEAVYFWQGFDRSWKTSNVLTWNHSYGANDITALAGYEEYRKWGGEIDIKKKGMNDISLTDFNSMTTADYINGYNWEYSSRSWFGRVNYAYDNRYLFEVNMRYDGSSRFSPENRWGFFPSASAAWRLTQEEFMKDINWLNNLKLRVSYGKLGNNSIGNYEWQSLYSTDAKVSFGDELTSGLRMYKFANAALSWESTKITNIGLDFSLFNSRLNGTVDIYNKDTDGILYRPTLSATLQNFTAPLQNLAEVNNKGAEITLTWSDRAGAFNYNISGNVSFNRNRVTKYKGPLVREWQTDQNGHLVWVNNIGDVSAGGGTRVVEGHEMNEYYMLNRYHGNGNAFNADGSVNIHGGPKDGMIRTEQDMRWLEAMMLSGYRFFPSQGIGKGQIWYGDYIYADENGDGIYGDDNDRKFQGCSNMPKIYFGLQGGVTWKGIDLSMTWSGAAGFKINYYEVSKNSTNVIHGYGIGKEVGYDHYFYDPANPQDPRTNTTSKNPRFVVGASAGQQMAESEYHLQKGDYLKLRNLTVGYTFPKVWTSKVFMQNVRVYASFENLCTITKFKGLDPEMMSGDGYAPMRSYAFGLNVTF